MFHLSNQAEARTNTRIANLTAEVAKQTQRDSASMITIAAVTMFFLPGTFISTVMSSVFFSRNDVDGSINASGQSWILLATVIPATVFVFGFWYGWLRWRIRRDTIAIEK